MCKKLILLLLLLAFGLTASADAATIIWVSDNKSGNQADQGWIDLLRSFGWTVDMSFANKQGRTLDAAKIAALNAADLVIISRDTDSGQYDDGTEPTDWNQITAPMILQVAHIARSNRWKWLNSTGTSGYSPTMQVTDPSHVIFDGVQLDGNNQVAVLTGDSSFVNTTGAGNGTLLATRPDNGRVWIVEWAQGQEYYSAAGQIAGGKRMWFASGGVGPDGWYNVTPEGERMFINACVYMGDLQILPAVYPTPADGAIVPATAPSGSGVYMMLDYQPGDTATTHTAYFSESFDDVNDRLAGASLGSPPWGGTAYYVGLDTDPLPAFARVPLEPGNTYYWAVDESDGVDTYKSKVWSFTIMPQKAWDPSPPEGAKFVNIDPAVNLGWQGGDVKPDGNDLSYDVYYGTERAAVETATTPNANVTTTSHAAAGLAKDTAYYWRVDVVLTGGPPTFPTEIIPGDIWEFSTLPDIPITDPNLMGFWKFEAGSGTTAIDWSGHERHGTLLGNVQWVAGADGGALEFYGTDNSYVNIDGYTGILGTNPFSVTAWVKSTNTGNRTITSWGTGTSRERVDFRLYQGRLRVEHGAGNRQGDTVLTDDEWHHVALTIKENATISYPDVKLYLDGQDDTRTGTDTDAFNLVAQHDMGIGIRVHNDQREFIGTLDEVRLYDKELSGPEIAHLMDPAKAYYPRPGDGDVDVDLGAKLIWSPGTDESTGADYTKHDVYFSTSFEDVNTGTVPTATVTGANEYAVSLDYYGRHYWRIDEVNAGGEEIRGTVWTFKATYNPALVVDPNLLAWYKFDGDAKDSSGYGRDGTEYGDPVYVDGYDAQAVNVDDVDDSVVYFFAEERRSAYTVAVWVKPDTLGQDNYSSVFSNYYPNTAGFQIDVDGTYPGNYRYHESVDGTLGPVTAGWIHLAVACDGVNALLYYNGSPVTTVVVTDTLFNKYGTGVNRNRNNWFDGTIDEVRIYDYALSLEEIENVMRINVAWAWSPNPANGETGVDKEPTLSWKPGDYAPPTEGHYVYFGADDPANLALVASQPQSPNNYSPGALDLGRTYYWAVDEANGAAPGGVDPGKIWSFTTIDHLVVDDMESYENQDPNWIFNTWKDGFGDADCAGGNGTGSGLAMSASIYLGGYQSMEYVYDNDGQVAIPCPPYGQEARAYYSKIQVPVADLPSRIGSDWTAAGAEALALQFYGSTGNAIEPMWVELTDGSGGKATASYGGYADEDPCDIDKTSWHQWNINLQDFADGGVTLSDVNSIAIGIGDPDATEPGGSGLIYFDDIRLYAPRCILSRRDADFALVDYAPEGTGGDCVIDYKELDVMSGDWIEFDYTTDPIAPDPCDLALWLKLENDVNDSSGNDRHATLVGAPWWVAGAPNAVGQDSNAIDLDGAADAIHVNHGTIATDVYSMAMWLKCRDLASYTGGYRAVMHTNTWSAGSIHFHLRRNADPSYWLNFDWNNGFSATANGAEFKLVEGEWYHAVMVADRTVTPHEAKIYLDGVLAAENTGTAGALILAEFNIGAYQQNGRWFNGQFDDIRVYTSALSQAEVLAVGGLEAIYTPVTSPANVSDDEPINQKVVNFKDYAVLTDRWLEEQLWPRP